MFKGWYERTTDEKGRLSIPTKFRDTILRLGSDVLIITLGKDGCLDAYPSNAWNELEDAISKSPRFHQSMIDFRRSYVSPAQECPMDGHGRIIIPQILRKYAGLDKDIMIVGQVKIFEIWDAKRWQDIFQKSQKEMDWSKMADLGL